MEDLAEKLYRFGHNGHVIRILMSEERDECGECAQSSGKHDEKRGLSLREDAHFVVRYKRQQRDKLAQLKLN